jgi:hypothetical protein
LLSNSLLTLGSFSFEGLESPGQILLKTKQRLVIHHLGTGSLSSDSLGNDVETVAFRGIFTGTGVTDRIRSIEYMRSQGVPIVLTWGSRTLAVIIEAFELNYTTNQWVPYKLTCYVVRSTDSGVGGTTDQMPMSPNAQIADIVGLLQNTNVTLTADQRSALAILAEANYDIPPSDSLQQAQDVLSSIESQLGDGEADLQNSSIGNSISPRREAQLLTDIISDASLQATLLLAHNRIMDISVTAEATNQQ